jgi:hypothetical protein
MVTSVSGVATFTDLEIDKSGTGYTLTAASTGLTSAISSSFFVGAVPAVPAIQGWGLAIVALALVVTTAAALNRMAHPYWVSR